MTTLPVEAPDTGISQTLFGTDNPAAVIQRASKVAKILADVIEKQKLFTVIGGKKHVWVEGWQTLGAMVGVYSVVAWTRKLENGWEARVEARTKAGELVGAAESECLNTENNWSEAKKKEDHHLRSMAQTRATSKALASALRFIMPLAGYAGTPAEEMPFGGPPSPSDAVFNGARKTPPKDPQERPAAPPPAGDGGDFKEWTGHISKVTVANYDKKKDGKPTGEKGQRFTIYGITDSGAEIQFTTFSESHATDCKYAMPSTANPKGIEMTIRYSVGEFKGQAQYRAEEVFPVETGSEQGE